MIDPLVMNSHIIEVIDNLIINAGDKTSTIPIKKLRNYFLIKTTSAKTVNEAAASLKGLRIATKFAPFLNVK
jgi:hypothetical protein